MVWEMEFFVWGIYFFLFFLVMDYFDDIGLVFDLFVYGEFRIFLIIVIF